MSLPVTHPVLVNSTRQPTTSHLRRRPRSNALTMIGAGLGTPRATINAPKPAAPPAPTAPAAAAPAATPPDPRDSSYWDTVSGIRRTREGRLADLGQQDQYDQQDQASQLQRLVEANARNLMTAKQGANTRGLFYSTFLNNANTGIEKQTADDTASTVDAFRRAAAAREAARREITTQYGEGDQYGTEGVNALTDAIGRTLVDQSDDAPPAPAAVAGPGAPHAPAAAGAPVAPKSREEQERERAAHLRARAEHEHAQALAVARARARGRARKQRSR